MPATEMRQRTRILRPGMTQAAFALVALMALAAAYIGVMHATLPVSRIETPRGADRRDLWYFGIHVGGLVVAAVLGFGLGKWLNGLGLAFALLFVVVLGTLMVGVQLGSYELACHGTNDIVRHWTC